jgi:5-methylcytosine-specific restriction endonuclease McrA
VLDPEIPVENDEYFIIICELDEKDDIKDESVWIKANPIVATYEAGLKKLRSDLKIALDNPEKYKKSRHKYNKSEKSRKHFYEFGKQYREDGRRKEWEQNNKDKLKQYGLNHIHKTHDITDDEINQLYEYCNASCMYCGMAEEEHKEIYGQKLHKDHAYNEGSNGIDNCILACKSCNSSKRDNDWDVWYTLDNPKYTEERYIKINQWLEKFH